MERSCSTSAIGCSRRDWHSSANSPGNLTGCLTCERGTTFVSPLTGSDQLATSRMATEEVHMARAWRPLLLFLAAALVVISAAPAGADTTLFSEDFSGATPAANYTGAIAGTQVTVTANAVDIVGVLNGSFFTCANNAAGKLPGPCRIAWGGPHRQRAHVSSHPRRDVHHFVRLHPPRIPFDRYDGYEPVLRGARLVFHDPHRDPDRPASFPELHAGS